MAFIRMGGGAESKITITYDVDGTEYTEDYKKGDDILHPSSFVPTKEGYTLYGWSLTDGGDRLEEAIATQNLRLYALFLQTVVEFAYTGAEQTFQAKKGVTYLLEVYGAKGGRSNDGNLGAGGNGGYSAGYKKFDENTMLYIHAGGVPYNGGGSGAGGSSGVSGGAGGGATHIATKSGLLSTLSSYVDDILIVAGGGGGNGYATATSGTGGGISGGERGGTQTSGYAFGYGQNGISFESSNHTRPSGGGGGGLYGGYCQLNFNSGLAGGGSGYIGGVTDGSTSNGVNSGNGSATITIASVE